MCLNLWYNVLMNQNESLQLDENPILPESRAFSEAVTAAYEELVPESFNFTWGNRVERFIQEGVGSLWNQFNQASTSEKVVYGGLIVAGGYVGYHLLRSAVDSMFNLGNWMSERINSIRQNSLELFLSITLGATVIGLVPLLYQGVARGNLSLSHIFQVWDDDGFQGLLDLLTENFPEGVRNMSEDVREFIRASIGSERFDAWFDTLDNETVTPVIPPVIPFSETPEVSVEEPLEPVEAVEDPNIAFTPSDLTSARWAEFVTNPSLENFTFFINSLVENEGGLVVREGRIWVVDEVGELFDLSRWATFQYGASVSDVLAAGEADPEARIGAYIFQYLRETPKFFIAASSLEFINLLRGRHASLFIRPAINSLTWGAWPVRLTGVALNYFGGTAAFVRFTRDGVIFLTRSGANLAKLTAQGSILLWQGGRFVAAEAARQVSRVAATRALSSAITQTYTRTIGRQVAHFTSRNFTSRLLGVAGWRGGATAAMWANDATVIGVLDDIVAVGLTAWLATDVYRLIQLTRSTLTFKRLITEQESLEITNLTALDVTTQARLDEIASDENFTEADAFEFLSSLPRAEFKIERVNGRHEEYLMVRGQILSVHIFAGDEELASFTEDDIETLSQELPPPVEFDRWEIDYHQRDEDLYAHYRLAFNYVLNETGWSALDYDIKDNQTIEVKRRDSQQAVFLHRVDENWFIGADRETSFDLFQAISMANLINRVEFILLSEIRLPSGEAPFYAQADGLYVARPGFDTTLLEGEDDSWYHQFYQGQLGLNPDIITGALNFRYQDSTRPQLQQNLDDYLQDFIPA